MATFNRADLERSLDRLSILRFWPASDNSRAEIGRLLVRMVPSKEALDWLVDAMVNRVGEWHGPVELRGVLCAKFHPVDGVEAYCSLSRTFTAAEAEAQYLEGVQSQPRTLAPSSAAIVKQIAEAK